MSKQSKAAPIVKIVFLGLLFMLLTAMLVVGIVFGEASINLFSFNIKFFDTTGYSEMSSDTETLNNKNIKDITIDWTSGQIDVVKSNQNGITISESYNNNDKISKDDKLQYKIDGDKLIIRSSQPKIIFFGYKRSKNLTLSLPVAEYNKLKINTASARVGISDLNINNLDVDSVSGEQKYSNITANCFNTGSVSGKFIFSDCKANSIDIDSVSGSVDYSGEITGDADISTVSGGAKIKTAVTPSKLDFNSTSADIELWLPNNASFTASSDSVSGDFSSDFSLIHRNGKYICGSGTSKFDFDSTSGDVQINPIR